MSSEHRLLRPALGAFVLLLALAAPPGARAFGWPVKPFDRPHPIRGGFDDPRFGQRSRAFHFGIDVCAADGAPVYAVSAGIAYLEQPFPQTVEVLAGAAQVFGYWHVVPVVANHQRVAEHQLLGHVATGWGHVHLDEKLGGRYVDPLAPGRLAPYVDRVPPAVARISFERRGHRLDPFALPPSVDVVVDVSDGGGVRPAAPWDGAVRTPATLALRLLDPQGRPRTAWRTVVDLGLALLPARLFWQVYAPGTRQNEPGHPGRYLLYAARGFRPGAVAGATAVQVMATDDRGNATLATQAFLSAAPWRHT